MEHGSGGSEVLTQALVFLGATCVLIPALKKLKISAVMGFLFIGVAMGPHVLGRLANDLPWLAAFEFEQSEPTLLLAELGIVFLLFVIGLEVSLERLWSLRRYVFGLGLLQVVLSAAAITAVTMAFGNEFTVSAVIGIAFALSSTALVLQLLREIRAETNMALVLITHNFGVVADICDRVIVMHQGRIVEQGASAQLYAAPQHDYTRKLFAAAPGADAVT